MFRIFDFDTILEEFEQRNNVIKKLDKIPLQDSQYLKFISSYKTTELNADIEIFDYDLCLKENRYIKDNYDKLSNRLWIIGRTGQGDEWFIDIETNEVLFYDHNKGEYEESFFTNMEIDFLGFLKMGILIKQLENYLDEGKDVMQEYIRAMNSISSNLYNNYPYKY